MDNHEVIVLSTGLNTPKVRADRCKASVLSQTVHCTHVFLDGGGATAAENRHQLISHLPPATIVCEVDCDDWLGNDRALERVVKEYDEGAWMTWGQFVYDTGIRGWAAPWQDHPRHAPWFATHLKTYRAGLFQQIKEQDLRTLDGGWCDKAIDNLIMFPMLEMAGPERGRFIPDVLYVYTGWGTDEASVAEARRIRAMPEYPRLEDRTW